MVEFYITDESGCQLDHMECGFINAFSTFNQAATKAKTLSKKLGRKLGVSVAIADVWFENGKRVSD